MFSSCMELVGKSLVGHLLKDGGWFEEGVDVHRLGFRLVSLFAEGLLVSV